MTRSTFRRPHALTLLCIGSTGTACACESVCTRGCVNIRRDEVTKGYDYYGGTSNMAARTESVGNGGQVLLTRAAYMSLSTAEREQVEVTALGGVALRGVPVPVEMYQLDAVPGRTFAALRLDREMPDLDDGSDFESSEDVSMYSARTGTAQAVVSVLTVTYGTLAPRQRLKALMPLCERWNVRLPRRPSFLQDEEYCRLVIDRLAVKMSSVMERKGQLGIDQNMSFTLSATAPAAHDTASGTWGRRGGEQVHARRFGEAASQSNSVEVHAFTADEPRFRRMIRLLLSVLVASGNLGNVCCRLLCVMSLF
ncbi:hypothetical protein TcYC6_0122200 [Trypanosoma cruzi]|nr:hypothetical protein TcYC6_0122200 [Trypanosoma cruzi]